MGAGGPSGDSVLGGLRGRWSVEQPPPTFKMQVQGLIQTHQEDSNSGVEAMLANAMDLCCIGGYSANSLLTPKHSTW